MAIPLPSDKYCSLYVLSQDSLREAATQSKYESLWSEFISAASSISLRLEKNPWMGKLIKADIHDHIWDHEDASSSTSPGSALSGFSTPSASPAKGGRARIQAAKSPVSVLDATTDVFGGSRGSETDEAALQWYQILDAHTLEDVVSRLSLQSLSRLTCVCHGLREIAHVQKLGGAKSGVLLLRLDENLGKSYEPSTLALPLKISDVPPVQKWDKYSMHANMVSHLYRRLAEALPEVFKYQAAI